MAAKLFVAGLILCSYVSGVPVDDAAPDGTKFRDGYKYHEEANGWLKLNVFPTNWAEARMTCYLEGASLASPIDNSLYSVMEKIVQDSNKTVYTGVNSMASVNDYASIDGTPLRKMPIKWAEGEPNNKDGNQWCLVLTPHGMADEECTSVHHFLCYKKKVEGENLKLNECGTYGQNYEKNERTGSCYKFHDTRATWHRAHSVCNSEGGHLAIINSEEEGQILGEMAANSYHEPQTFDVLIGFYLWPVANTWPDHKPIFFSTVDGKTLEESGYAHWANSTNNMDNIVAMSNACGTFQVSKNEFRGLHVMYCYDTAPFMCEIDKPALSM